jgi:hypothetical protein
MQVGIQQNIMAIKTFIAPVVICFSKSGLLISYEQYQ